MRSHLKTWSLLALACGTLAISAACTSTSIKQEQRIDSRSNTEVNTSGIIDLENARISNSTVKVTQVIGQVSGLPAGTYTQILNEIDGIELVAAKRDLKIINYTNTITPTPSKLGWKWVGTYSIEILNSSTSKTYNVAGAALLAGRAVKQRDGKEVLITSEDGHFSSTNALMLEPGQSGTLQFSVNSTADALFRKAELIKASLLESNVRLITPNDGVVWRPNWPDSTGISGVMVGLTATQVGGPSASAQTQP